MLLLLGNTDKVKNLPKSAYIPFAMGQRSCIGFNFALQEVKIFLPKLVWRYAWHKEGETATEYDPFFQVCTICFLRVENTLTGVRAVDSTSQSLCANHQKDSMAEQERRDAILINLLEESIPLVAQNYEHSRSIHLGARSIVPQSDSFSNFKSFQI